MKGTEKQIQYAQDILAKVKGEAAEEIKRAEKCIAERAAEGKPSRYTKVKMKAERVLVAIEEVAKSDIHAGIVIDRLSTYDKFWQWLDEYEYDVDRMIRRMI